MESQIKLGEGFNFYDNLRYVLPGYFLLFLLGPTIFPDWWKSIDIFEKLVYGLILSFVIHPLSLYKWAPGATSIRKEFYQKHENLLGKKDSYIMWDMSILSARPEERSHFRKYFGLGALKLDLSMTLVLVPVIQLFRLAISFLSNTGIPLFGVLVIPVICIFIFILIDDGLNDMRRAFNILLYVTTRDVKEGELKSAIELIDKSQEILIMRERRMLHPTDATKMGIFSLARRMRIFLLRVRNFLLKLRRE